ncbi:MAG: hypothetical protein P1P88_19405 [Bacteroidales bacterium]|nr:hypothetical protein [Bacteroidales bacterium]
MDRKTKRRILGGLILLLILINLSAIATFGYNKYLRNKQAATENVSPQRDWDRRHQRIKLYVKKELELDSNQFNTYCKLKNENIDKLHSIYGKIGEYQKLIINEINKTTPDSLILLQLSDSVGMQHRLIQIETTRHFLAIKSILSSKQADKFQEMLNRMEHGEWMKKNRKYRSDAYKNDDGQRGNRHRHGNRN